jgi:hypothetical protein
MRGSGELRVSGQLSYSPDSCGHVIPRRRQADEVCQPPLLSAVRRTIRWLDHLISLVERVDHTILLLEPTRAVSAWSR